MKAKVTLEIETPFTYVVSQDTVIQWFQDILQAAEKPAVNFKRRRAKRKRIRGVPSFNLFRRTCFGLRIR